MGLTAITGVLSRYFVVGFFLPAFFTLVALSRALDDVWTPDEYATLDRGAQILVLGGCAVLTGFTLVGLNFQVIRLFEGYPLRRRLLRPLEAALVGMQRRSRERIASRAWLLHRRFPAPERLLPTLLGNRIRAAEDATEARWGLDHIAVWPRIDALLSEREQELHVDARSNLAFALNGVLGAFALGVVLVAQAVVHGGFGGWRTLAIVAPFASAYAIYRLLGVSAAERFGTEMRASVDLHRLEVYDRLGLALPGSREAERQMAVAVSRSWLYGAKMPARHRAANVAPAPEPPPTVSRLRSMLLRARRRRAE